MKKLKCILLPTAEADLLRQATYYLESAGENVADRFYRSAESAFDEISSWPHTGTPVRSPETKRLRLRSWPVKGFSDVRLYYRCTKVSVDIVRILHGKRDIERLLRNH